MPLAAFDSNVLIYVLENDTRFGERAHRAFLDIEKTGGVCSTVLITESLHGTISSVDQLIPLTSPAITVVPVDIKIAAAAGGLRGKYGLKTLDAIHIATALEMKATHFITNDKALLGLAIAGLEVRGL